jgi:hypothetical protein
LWKYSEKVIIGVDVCENLTDKEREDGSK